MRQTGKTLTYAAFFTLALTACGEPTAETPTAAEQTTPEQTDSSCERHARLILKFQGTAGGGHINRDRHTMSCESMRRPDGEGARLRFVVEEDLLKLSLIIATPTLQRGVTGDGLPANLTLSIDHGPQTQFFGTQGADSCWVDVHTQDLIGNERYTIAGEVYCIAPLPEVNGSGSTAIELLEFSTNLDWNAT